MTEIDHDAAILRMRELAEDMDDWQDEDNYSAELNCVCALADQAKALAQALESILDDVESRAQKSLADNGRAALAAYRATLKA